MSDEKKPEVIEDGGPAFPHTITIRTDDGFKAQLPVNGMSLRDHFAGVALGGMLADPNFQSQTYRAAEIAYAYADAMIQFRKNQKEGA